MPALPPERFADDRSSRAQRPPGREKPESRRSRPGLPTCPPPGPARPLPDPAVVQMFLVPDSAPPYDDEAPAAGGSVAGAAVPPGASRERCPGTLSSPGGSRDDGTWLPALPGRVPDEGTRAPAPPRRARDDSPGAPAPPGKARDDSPGAPAPPGKARDDSPGAPAPPGKARDDSPGAPALPGKARDDSPGAPAPPEEAGDGTGAPPPDGRPGEPGPRWPSHFAQVLAETLAGARPARQMAPWATEQVREHIQRLGAQLATGQRPRVRRVITCCPAPDALEMTVVIGFGPRVRALAVRLERVRPGPTGPGRPGTAPTWRCTAVEAA